MRTPEELISILVHLSMADGHIARSERKMLHHIGDQKGLSEEKVEELIENPMPIPRLSSLTSDDRFDYLKYIIQLMKADKKVFRTEIEFCEKMAMALGYLPGVVAELSAYIYSDPNISTDRDMLVKIANRFKMKRGEEN